ncbi:sigma-70 family RNA polymerase sigma factor [Pseudooceanicola nanhaiensis]|uniref:sigma-70 family RNA polymerase sigma factor n=1 Tax=Pseudooceanicola nanhaiensis TaxID=375761 RepID=UPI001CD2CD58|nr:sigma-70 family RNA polymerase sigma factor [Pseudooceanicola nanhaiensis]MCA0922611.1 sigma-70 family RNA polymerase sigma factor [Pseudooceanicola nanhaiensis]
MREPLLAVDDEREAICKWQDDRDQRALELLLRSHARQAWSQAARWTDNPVHLEDLASEGLIGLMRAADNFDRSQNVRFSTYSAWWVMNCISAALARIKTVIDIPPRTYLDARSGRLEGEDASLVQVAMSGMVALDAPVTDDGASPADLLVSPEMTPEECAAARSAAACQIRALAQAMADLDPLEVEIIRRRKLQPVPERVEDLAAALDMPKDRLRQIEKRALLRLRQRLVAQGVSLAAMQ